MTVRRDVDVIFPRSLVLGAIDLDRATARELVVALKVGMREVTRRDATQFSADAYDVLRSIEMIAAGVGSSVGAPMGSVRDDDKLDDVVGVTAAAKLAGVHRNAIYGRIARHTLPADRDGRGRIVVRREDVEVVA